MRKDEYKGQTTSSVPDDAAGKTNPKRLTLDRLVYDLGIIANDNSRIWLAAELRSHIDAVEGELLALQQQVETLRKERDKALLFKKNTHLLLDEAEVPQFENEECRVSHRIRWLAAEVERMQPVVKAAVIWRKADIANEVRAEQFMILVSAIDTYRSHPSTKATGQAPRCKYCGGPVDKQGQVHAGDEAQLR